MARDPEAIQRDIDRSRDALADTLDQLAVRASPRRFVEHGRRSARDFLTSTRGRIAIGVAGGVVALLVARRINLAVRNHRAKANI